MNIQSVDRIITAKDYDRAHGSGKGSALAWIFACRDRIKKERGIFVIIMEGGAPGGTPVQARIWQGQWIADCECGGASFVDPDEPIFFCFSCGNRRAGGNCRAVIFPDKDTRAEIERLLLDRPVDDMAGLTDLERVGLARPLIVIEGAGGLARNWQPGETADDLREQNKPVEAWRKKLKKR